MLAAPLNRNRLRTHLEQTAELLYKYFIALAARQRDDYRDVLADASQPRLKDRRISQSDFIQIIFVHHVQLVCRSQSNRVPRQNIALHVSTQMPLDSRMVKARRSGCVT